ncbi:high affinity immunoglobulin epsilon receptor subunit gamma [Pelobates fuscus]|uniref:high affinity immunoglobulin epsilon receptor subunit gamma n=1 Tax=Pelobates fuscus TaxID=191477 RepID=UPI002FE48438
MQEPEICYILDAILFLYGIILTALYCHLKIKTNREKKKAESHVYDHLNNPEKRIYDVIGGDKAIEMKKGANEGLYTGLGPVEKGTYETLTDKRT